MAHRYARKKTGWTKAKRQAAGRKAWRTKVRRYGSKAAAVRASFGKRGKSRRSASPRRSRNHRVISSTRRRLEAQALGMIKKKYGTEGLPPSPAEVRAAQVFVSRTYGMKDPRWGGKAIASPEERRRAAFKAEIDRKLKAEAARRAFARLAKERAEKAAAERERMAREARAAVEAELRSL